MLTLDQKRAADAHITCEFLKDNQPIITRIIGRFGEIAAQDFRNCHFYLKGGNAITLLQNMEGEGTGEMKGDYDFQFMPSREDYDNWTVRFDEIDQRIIGALTASLDAIEDPGQFITTALAPDNLLGWARREKNGIPFDGVTAPAKRSGLQTIGRGYGAESYAEIFQHEFKDNRLKIADEEIVAQDLQGPDKGPMIYVNYTIPGFILYRMVYSFSYQDRDGKRFSLKSEIIDVSVPRKGSAEVYMSQDGVITHFRDSGRGFKIPGWGYHFYENFNLLQEIKLHTSGSKQKREKRECRCELALSKLTVNTIHHGAADYSLTFKEPFPGGSRPILNYFEALAYNVFDYSIYPREMIEALRERILKGLSDHFTTVIAGLVTKEINKKQSGTEVKYKSEIYKFVDYKLDKKFDNTVRNMGDIQDALNKVLNPFKSHIAAYKTEAADMVQDKTYWIISPYREFQSNNLFPMDFVAIAIRSDVYLRFKNFVGERMASDITKTAADGSAFLMTVHGKGAFYLLVQECEAPPPHGAHLTQFLERSILECQRYALAKTLQS